MALVVAPAILLAALGLRALRVERIEREQALWRQQSQLVLLADSAISNALSALEDDLHRGERDSPADSPAREAQKSTPITRLVFDNRQALIFPYHRLFFGEIDYRPAQAYQLTLPDPILQLIEQARKAEALNQDLQACDAYRRIRTAEPKLRPWADLNIARIQSRPAEPEIVSQWKGSRWMREDAVSPAGIPVAMLACSYAAQLPAERRAALHGLFRETLENLRGGRWWLSYPQRAFYDEELVSLTRDKDMAQGAAAGKDACMDQLAGIERAVRQSPPRRRDAAAINYEYTENVAILVLWSPAGTDSQTWQGAAIRADQVGQWLTPALNPLFEGLPFGAELRDGRQQRLWDVGVQDPAVQRQERLRSIPHWELGFTPSAGTGGIDTKRLLWYGFILLPVVMLVVGVAAATLMVRRELELGRMQSDFVAAVSHEFKSPLTSIRLLVERIAGRRYSSPDAADQYCRAIDSEAGRLERLVSRLLDWQQIEAGRKQYRFETSSAVEVARSVVGRLRPQAETRGVLIDMKVAGEIADFPFDRAAITDALENLVDNAIKYSRTGGRITVDLHPDGDQVRIEVRDEGIGIDPGDAPHIFEKFYRGRRGNQEDVRGTGLGLSLVKAAVEAHGGKVELRSAPGEGSRFILTLPIRAEEKRHAPGSDRG